MTKLLCLRLGRRLSSKMAGLPGGGLRSEEKMKKRKAALSEPHSTCGVRLAQRRFYLLHFPPHPANAAVTAFLPLRAVTTTWPPTTPTRTFLHAGAWKGERNCD